MHRLRLLQLPEQLTELQAAHQKASAPAQGSWRRRNPGGLRSGACVASRAAQSCQACSKAPGRSSAPPSPSCWWRCRWRAAACSCRWYTSHDMCACAAGLGCELCGFPPRRPPGTSPHSHISTSVGQLHDLRCMRAPQCTCLLPGHLCRSIPASLAAPSCLAWRQQTTCINERSRSLSNLQQETQLDTAYIPLTPNPASKLKLCPPHSCDPSGAQTAADSLRDLRARVASLTGIPAHQQLVVLCEERARSGSLGDLCSPSIQRCTRSIRRRTSESQNLAVRTRVQSLLGASGHQQPCSLRRPLSAWLPGPKPVLLIATKNRKKSGLAQGLLRSTRMTGLAGQEIH